MGRFVKGQSGNHNGRPKVAEEFRAKARKAVDEHVLTAWVAEVEGQGREWVRCSELLAAYGYGKPTQPLSGEDGGAIPLEVRNMSDEQLKTEAARILGKVTNG